MDLLNNTNKTLRFSTLYLEEETHSQIVIMTYISESYLRSLILKGLGNAFLKCSLHSVVVSTLW